MQIHKFAEEKGTAEEKRKLKKKTKTSREDKKVSSIVNFDLRADIKRVFFAKKQHGLKVLCDLTFKTLPNS